MSKFLAIATKLRFIIANAIAVTAHFAGLVPPSVVAYEIYILAIINAVLAVPETVAPTEATPAEQIK